MFNFFNFIIMEKIKFVDSSFKELSEAKGNPPYAVDLGVQNYQFGKDKGKFHLFCSVSPLAKNLEWYEIRKVLDHLRELNPDIKFTIPDHHVYDQLCKLGVKIDNGWIRCFADCMDEMADVYVVFGFEPNAERHQIELF